MGQGACVLGVPKDRGTPLMSYKDEQLLQLSFPVREFSEDSKGTPVASVPAWAVFESMVQILYGV